MKLTAEQANKIATMMLNAAKYKETWIDMSPVEIPREGREGMISDIADALVAISHGYIKKEDAVEQLSRTNGHNGMEFPNLSHEQIEALSKEFCTAPVYANKKGKQFTFYHGVWSQSYKCFNINVGSFVGYTLVGYCKDKRKQCYNIMKSLVEVEITTEYHLPEYHGPKESNEINELKR
jgi:hypothetical protein